MIDKVTTIDNAHLYCVYTMLYVNDLACNSVKQIKSYITQCDKEAKKIFGALEKRCNRYLRAIDKICGSGNIFYADYNGEIDDMVSADIENLTQAIRNAYNGEESENVEYFTKVEIARTFVELSISVIDDLLDALKDKELKTGNIKGYKLLEIRGIIDNFAKWVYRKAKTNIDLNEDKDAISALDAVTKSLCDYKNFIKAYEYAVEMEKQDSSKKVNN